MIQFKRKLCRTCTHENYKPTGKGREVHCGKKTSCNKTGSHGIWQTASCVGQVFLNMRRASTRVLAGELRIILNSLFAFTGLLSPAHMFEKCSGKYMTTYMYLMYTFLSVEEVWLTNETCAIPSVHDFDYMHVDLHVHTLHSMDVASDVKY